MQTQLIARAGLEQEHKRSALQPTRDDAGWYILRSASGLEFLAERHLRKSGQSIFLPRERKWRPSLWRRRTAVLAEYPRFPTYLFARLAPSAWPDFRRWPFIRSVLGIAGRPVPLAPGEIERLMAEDGRPAPHVDSLATHRAFVAGQRARILDGPFRDFVVVIDGITERGAEASVEIFGRPAEVVLPLQWLEPA